MTTLTMLCNGSPRRQTESLTSAQSCVGGPWATCTPPPSPPSLSSRERRGHQALKSHPPTKHVSELVEAPLSASKVAPLDPSSGPSHWGNAAPKGVKTPS